MSESFAQQIVRLSSEQVSALISRNWQDIQTNLDEEEEITLGIKIKITNRSTEPGEQADKSERVKSALSFSKRFTDSIEAALADPDQPELSFSGPAHIPVPVFDDDGNEIPVHDIGHEDAGTTNLGDAIGSAVSQVDTTKIVLSLRSDWEANPLVKAFNAAAKKAEWPEAAIGLMKDQLKACETVSAMIETLRPHVIEPAV